MSGSLDNSSPFIDFDGSLTNHLYSVVDDADEAARIAGLFCERYGAGDRSLGDAAVDATMFWRIAVDSLVGKKANC